MHLASAPSEKSRTNAFENSELREPSQALQTSFPRSILKGQGPGLVNVLWGDVHMTQVFTAHLREHDHALSSSSSRSKRTDMRDRSLCSACACTSARSPRRLSEARAFARTCDTVAV